MTKMPSTFKYQKQVWSLFGIIALLLGLYLFLVGKTVYNTTAAQQAERAISSMTAELAKMEFAYLSAQAKINMDLASQMGFIEPESVVVAKVKATGATAFVAKDKI
ncbi:MAG: hypothetical protein WC761_04945 [Candidatus Paceibacterota bacterium]|jgi:hypothetical protein